MSADALARLTSNRRKLARLLAERPRNYRTEARKLAKAIVSAEARLEAEKEIR